MNRMKETLQKAERIIGFRSRVVSYAGSYDLLVPEDTIIDQLCEADQRLILHEIADELEDKHNIFFDFGWTRKDGLTFYQCVIADAPIPKRFEGFIQLPDKMEVRIKAINAALDYIESNKTN